VLSAALQVRGISGGQRKRVNVGLELVAEPSLLSDTVLSSVDLLSAALQVRGISGGQRKRVNVGLELVAEPSLLCCALLCLC
jgi:ABC-type multidrug transport system ATPase subunit